MLARGVVPRPRTPARLPLATYRNVTLSRVAIDPLVPLDCNYVKAAEGFGVKLWGLGFGVSGLGFEFRV